MAIGALKLKALLWHLHPTTLPSMPRTGVQAGGCVGNMDSLNFKRQPRVEWTANLPWQSPGEAQEALPGPRILCDAPGEGW